MPDQAARTLPDEPRRGHGNPSAGAGENPIPMPPAGFIRKTLKLPNSKRAHPIAHLQRLFRYQL